MKKLFTLITLACCAMNTMAQGWPENYGGVMLQGFYWDSYTDSKWSKLQNQADNMKGTFDLVWIPQSANCGGQSMGYDDLYWFENYNSSFGTKEELLSMISTFKDKGIGTIADIVINHRRNVSNWVDFPREYYNGTYYQLTSTDICANDDGGATKNWATANGYSLSSYNDTGEGWSGMRDLDHNSANVQANVKAYLKMLMDDFGYTGFRYDMVKGYSASFTGIYNTYAKPQFSVGECWDGTQTIRNWIDGTKVNNVPTSAAFDFQFRYTVRNAVNSGNWTKLTQQNDNNWPLMSNNYNGGSYRRWAVTFVENHDTEYRSSASQQDPLKKDTLAANAYLLSMPGTPCVFYKHWLSYPEDIKAMVSVRKGAGIHNMSSYSVLAANGDYQATAVTGTNGTLLAVVGKGAETYAPNATSWVKVLSGYHYAYYLSSTMNTAWADMASGSYTAEELKVMLSAVSNQAAKLVYTTDGSTPTAASTQVNSSTTITLPVGQTTLKVGLLVGSTVSGVITREYNITAPAPSVAYDINVYVNADVWSTTLTSVNFWTWGGDGTHAPTNATWPGDAVSTYKTIDGKKWFYKTFTIHSEDDCVNFVFNIGSGSPQTVDIENINAESYFEIATTKDGKNHNYVIDRTSTYSGIGNITTEPTDTGDGIVYDLQGRRVKDMKPGLYILNGRKFTVK